MSDMYDTKTRTVLYTHPVLSGCPKAKLQVSEIEKLKGPSVF